jgi:two-component system sensor histidine kinase PilS (NtrC family)
VDALNFPDLVRSFAWARLAIAVLLFGAAPLVALSAGPDLHVASVAGALVVIAGSSAILLTLREAPPRLANIARLTLALDITVVTLIVMATGGPQSVFAFLYVLVVIASCVLLSRSGALAMAGASSLLYAGVVLGRTVLPLDSLAEQTTDMTAFEVLTMFLNTGTFVAVAIVAGGLAERYRSAHHALEDHRKDLSDLQAFKDLIFHSVGTALVALDPQHRITAYNRAAAEMAGISASEAIGQTWAKIFGPAIPLDEIEAAVRADGRAYRRHELTIHRPDGVEVPVAFTFWALRSGRGEIVGYIGVGEDLSAIKQLEVRMRHADRLATVGRMAANLAHEIRNPLASLTGAIEVLTRDTAVDPTRERLVQIVARESERLNQFIKDFLGYARPAPLAIQTMNLAEALDEILVLLEHRRLPDQVKLIREYGESLPIDADPQQLRQLFWNLCLNAVEAMPTGGELRVGASHDGQRLEVWVSDTGRGIAAQDLPHIFEPFFSTKPEGTGIGLAAAHRIVHDHGGDIDVRSLAPTGTSFSVVLPVQHA